MRVAMASAVLLLQAAAVALAADTVVDGWTVKPIVALDKLDRCNADAPSRDLAIVLFPDGRLKALVADPTGTYAEAQIEVDVDIDGQTSPQVPTVVVANQLFLVTLGSGQAAIDRLSRARLLTIRSPVRTYRFDVSKLAAALPALQRCAAGKAAQ